MNGLRNVFAASKKGESIYTRGLYIAYDARVATKKSIVCASVLIRRKTLHDGRVAAGCT